MQIKKWNKTPPPPHRSPSLTLGGVRFSAVLYNLPVVCMHFSVEQFGFAWFEFNVVYRVVFRVSDVGVSVVFGWHLPWQRHPSCSPWGFSFHCWSLPLWVCAWLSIFPVFIIWSFLWIVCSNFSPILFCSPIALQNFLLLISSPFSVIYVADVFQVWLDLSFLHGLWMHRNLAVTRQAYTSGLPLWVGPILSGLGCASLLEGWGDSLCVSQGHSFASYLHRALWESGMG